jgi:hypothetical protein
MTELFFLPVAQRCPNALKGKPSMNQQPSLPVSGAQLHAAFFFVCYFLVQTCHSMLLKRLYDMG